MNIIKLLRYAVITFILSLVAIGEYHIFWMKDEYTKPYSGKVFHSYESSGRYSSKCFATVRFDNGDIFEVNTGHYCYRRGDRFTGQLDWNPIMGVVGVAYSWHPEGILLYTMLAGLFNVILVICVIGAFIYYVFIKKYETKVNK